ncbi:methyltransferase [Amycolatopsis carbonis]|uniref:Methyltransferase n=1 Tax=Amycolatopsis carbonis TaxID=715471 RepID=A0A9Y2I9A6_9PSEU|nr:methyltransferase [Amycolatopsis sp. 2-15]WIX75674.1 methyltransferase [Amycolatopsis sp. 2-15]
MSVSLRTPEVLLLTGRPHIGSPTEKLRTQRGGPFSPATPPQWRRRRPVDLDEQLGQLRPRLFEDDVASKIVMNCAANAEPGARIISMERVIGDTPRSAFGKLLDVQTFVTNQGRERTEDEFRGIFEAAGLTWRGVTGTRCDVSLIEGVV